MKTQIAFSLVTAVLETVLYAGVIYGWSSIYPVLIAEGFFTENCPQQHPLGAAEKPCQARADALNLVFSIASGVAPVLGVLTGVLLDRGGCWFTRTLLLSASGSGFLLIATAARPGVSSWVLYPAFVLIGFGGAGVATVNMQTSGNLWPNRSGLVVALVSGAFDSSTLTFLAVNRIYFAAGGGTQSFRTIFYFFAFLSLLFHVRTFTLTPRRSTPHRLPRGYAYGYREWACFRAAPTTAVSVFTVYQNEGGAEEAPVIKEVGPAARSLHSCFREVYTWTNMTHLCVVQFSIIYFIGIFNSWIVTKVDAAATESYTTVFGVILCCGILFAPLGGLLVDSLRKKFALRRLTPALATMKAVAVTQLIGDIAVLTMLTLSLVPSGQLQYLTFVLVAVSRSVVMGAGAAFINTSYPVNCFGVVYGCVSCAGGLVLLLQYPVAMAVSSGGGGTGYAVVNGVLLVMTALALGHPLYLLRHVKRRRLLLQQVDAVEVAVEAVEAVESDC